MTPSLASLLQMHQGATRRLGALSQATAAMTSPAEQFAAEATMDAAITHVDELFGQIVHSEATSIVGVIDKLHLALAAAREAHGPERLPVEWRMVASVLVDLGNGIRNPVAVAVLENA